jgi:hypothetical protein
MPGDLPAPVDTGAASNLRWSRLEETSDFFLDEDRLRGIFIFLVGLCLILLAALGAGLWRMNRASLMPPTFVGISHGLIFTGKPAGLASVHESDFDRELTDTIEVLFTRTEKGLPPEIHDFCSPGVITQVNAAYRDNALKYPAGFVQTLSVIEPRTIEARLGYRHVQYRGILSSRSVSAAQSSPIYLDCVFVIRGPTPLNAVGWRLERVQAISREDFYQREHEEAVRHTLNLSP